MKAIADTGFILAFANKNDRHHDWAIATAKTVETPIATCEAVLAEAAFHLGSASYVLALVDEGLLDAGFELDDELERMVELAGQFAKQRASMAELGVIRLSELHPKRKVITTDERRFRLFRRNGRQSIPLLAPPARRPHQTSGTSR